MDPFGTVRRLGGAGGEGRVRAGSGAAVAGGGALEFGETERGRSGFVTAADEAWVGAAVAGWGNESEAFRTMDSSRRSGAVVRVGAKLAGGGGSLSRSMIVRNRGSP
jgi:hypothetical protein